MRFSLALYGLAVASALLAGCQRFRSIPLSPGGGAAALEARALNDPGLKEFSAKVSTRVPAAWPPERGDFPALTLVALYFHPSLDLARAQWKLANAGEKTAGGQPNPILSAVPGYSLNPASGISPWFPLATVDIPIETAGKRGYRIAKARKLSEAARLTIASTAWQVRSHLRVGLLDYAAAQRRAELLQQQLQFEQQIVALLEQRLQAGAAVRTELTLPRIALAKTGVELADAVRRAAEARVLIAEALGLSARSIADVKFDFQLTISPDEGKELASAEARQQALLSRPDVLAALADYAASESALQIEIARQYPDIHLSPGYQYDQGEHKWSLGLSVELPVLNRNQGPIAEALAKREESAVRFLALQSRIMAEIDVALAARAAALGQVTRQSGLTQLAREQLAAVESLYAAGAADQLELSSARLEASVSDLAHLEAQLKAQQAIAQLEEAIQRPLEPWPSLEHGRSAKANSP